MSHFPFSSAWKLDLGAHLEQDGRALFKVWAPFASSLQLKIGGDFHSMRKDAQGYFSTEIEGISEEMPYSYLFPDGRERNDPASRYLPEGVFGPSLIIDSQGFAWTDAQWKGAPQTDLVFYECHVGTMTSEGTFDGVRSKLPYLKELGITCLELMPVAQFSGRWGWGYDGVYPYAPHNAYGDPRALKELVNACHEAGIAVCLDVVYNHFGPEGCFVHEFGPYFSEDKHTLWGKAINYDGPQNAHVRHFMIQNALHWVAEYHVDILRIDAVHAIRDRSTPSFLQELTHAVHAMAEQLQRRIYVVMESEDNDSMLLRPRNEGGVEADAWWDEDVHHALHVALTGEKHGYYQDYVGFDDLATALERGVVYTGQHSSYHGRAHGSSFDGIRIEQFIIFSQNHDQVGNRAQGDRLSQHIAFEEEKAIAFFLLLSPYLPLLFMGQEYGESHPFPFFADFRDEKLMHAVFEGRKKIGGGEFLYPDGRSFQRAKLSWEHKPPLVALYRALIELRRTSSAFRGLERKDVRVMHRGAVFCLEYRQSFGLVVNFAQGKQEIDLPFSFPGQVALHSEQEPFGGAHPVEYNAAHKRLTMHAPGGVVLYHSRTRHECR